MFEPSQADVRRFFCTVYAKWRDGLPMDALETLASQWVVEHPEYHTDFSDVDAALERMVPELNGILQWVEQLGEVDTAGIEPMAAVIPNTLRLREDVVDADPLTGGGRQADVLANAPAAEHGFFGVPKVIE